MHQQIKKSANLMTLYKFLSLLGFICHCPFYVLYTIQTPDRQCGVLAKIVDFKPF